MSRVRLNTAAAHRPSAADADDDDDDVNKK